MNPQIDPPRTELWLKIFLKRRIEKNKNSHEGHGAEGSSKIFSSGSNLNHDL